MPLIKGSDLTPAQVAEVKRAFVYRWTKDNNKRNAVWRNPKHKPSTPLISDQEWLAQYAFHFVKDGSRLSKQRRWAEPAYLADDK